MNEFYSREHHEEILHEREEASALAGDKEHSTKEEVLFYKSEERRLANEHERLLARAYTEAIKEDDRRETERSREAFAKTEETSFHEAQKTFTDFLKNSEDHLSDFPNTELAFVAALPGVAETVLTEETTDGNSPLIRCKLKFPVTALNDPNSYEERTVELFISQEGEIAGWEHAPLLLRANPEGRALLLNEVLRCLQELGITSTPVLELESALVKEGGGEPIGQQEGVGETLKPSFEATERLKILEQYRPLFICREQDASHSAALGGTYIAFVYPDVVIFDSLYYANATYFLPLTETIDAKAVEGFAAKTKEEQQSLLRSLLPEEFFTEIALSKSERRENNHRCPFRHPKRPDNEDDADYHAHLANYYDDVFAFVRGA